MANFDLNLKQYRDALRNLGMGELQIQELIRTRNRMENINITSPADGFILAPQCLRRPALRQRHRTVPHRRLEPRLDPGGRVRAGRQPGPGRISPSKLTLPSQGKTFTATVSKTLPQFDNITRTLKLRLEADNPDFTLKPDMFVDVELPLSLPEAIVVPAEAVLDAGLRQTVFRGSGNGYFEPRNVHIGSRVGDQVQIVHGLTPGERIVISGQFPARFRKPDEAGRRGRAGAAATDPVCGMTVDESKAKAAKRVSEYQGKTYSSAATAARRSSMPTREVPGQSQAAPIAAAATEPMRQ